MKNKICAGGFLTRGDKLLFGKRSKNKSWAPGCWDIVGGHSLKHEPIYDTLTRETFEELGITVESADLLTVMDVPDAAEKNFFTYYIYMITSWQGEPANISDEHTEINWFSRDQLNDIPLALPEYLTLIDIYRKRIIEKKII